MNMQNSSSDTPIIEKEMILLYNNNDSDIKDKEVEEIFTFKHRNGGSSSRKNYQQHNYYPYGSNTKKQSLHNGKDSNSNHTHKKSNSVSSNNNSNNYDNHQQDKQNQQDQPRRNQIVSVTLLIDKQLNLIDLPYDILLYIFKFLDSLSLVRVSQISNFFQSIASNHDLWKDLFYDKWGPMFPLVPVCTLKCCHYYFSSPYQNLEAINQLFSNQFYKSLNIPREMLLNHLESYSFKQMFKFRSQLFDHYHPLLLNGLQLLKDTASRNPSAWTKIDDPILQTNINKVTKSQIDKTIINDQEVLQFRKTPPTSLATHTTHNNNNIINNNIPVIEKTLPKIHSIRVCKVIPTRILKELLTLITDYEKIPLWDVTIRHCTGMIIKAPNNNNATSNRSRQYSLVDQLGQQIPNEPIINHGEPAISHHLQHEDAFSTSLPIHMDKDSCKKVDLLHKQIIGNLYMSYVRMIFTQSKYNEKFVDVTINNFKNIEDANNILNAKYPLSLLSNTTKGNIDILNFNSKAGGSDYSSNLMNISPSNNNNNNNSTTSSNNISIEPDVCLYQCNKSNMYNSIKHGFMEIKRKRGDDDEYHTTSPPNGQNYNQHNPNYSFNNYNNNNNNNSNNNNSQQLNQNHRNLSQDKLFTQPTQTLLTNKPTEEYTLKKPIYVVQHAIPFSIGGNKSEENPNNFILECFGSGFIFEPLNDSGKETKLTYILQLGKQDWMHDIYELVDEMAISRNTSINSLISHAYQINKKKSIQYDLNLLIIY
ncbi:cyclin-like F-box containing protein [Tieghemostelium lacteum]|uniref:Cyclin-like F-box containing protein n=1 Tax=Tieghemostelium lacteum TaxID=361077 RepID=A0A152A1F0_TIELA|nr:cyclin-like F-box containing protein [Tieghemostelium lacteum]|eukprot:KYR00034.1 cyclin-like F-box containing protein [Tieghemostelium lacteum]